MKCRDSIDLKSHLFSQDKEIFNDFIFIGRELRGPKMISELFQKILVWIMSFLNHLFLF